MQPFAHSTSAMLFVFAARPFRPEHMEWAYTWGWLLGVLTWDMLPGAARLLVNPFYWAQPASEPLLAYIESLVEPGHHAGGRAC